MQTKATIRHISFHIMTSRNHYTNATCGNKYAKQIYTHEYNMQEHHGVMTMQTNTRTTT